MQISDERPSATDGDHSIPAFTALADLASARVGGRALFANDDFFAPRSNLLKPEAAIFVPGKFTARGKWMDGWESRRRRTPGHDWCVIRLGMRGRVFGVDVDTSFFTGNFPSHCSIDGLDTSRPITKRAAAIDGAPWTTILPKTPLRGDAHNYFVLDPGELQPVLREPRPFESLRVANRESRFLHGPWTHLRLNIYPDGGVARLRAYGEVVVDWTRVARGRALDLADIRHGGLVLGASDMHFGARDNMIMPGRATNMGDGWETRRRRGPGHDWAIVRLGTTGAITRIEIDTNHFKGNYPDSASIDACLEPGADGPSLSEASWTELLPQTKLEAHRRHFFARELRAIGPVSHVRLNIFPDGGISRLRVHGIVAAP
jgi:allantoicase